MNPVPDVIKPFDFVLFGGTGDLAMRSLLPALYNHHCDELLCREGRIIASGRRQQTRDQFLADLQPWIQKQAADNYSEARWLNFAERVDYLSIDISDSSGFDELANLLNQHPSAKRIFYLSTAADFFAPTCQNLSRSGAVSADSIVAIEKPLGRDLESARQINNIVGEVFEEHQIYRVDHYLGKEPVQNLLALRFGNALFEPLWRRGTVREVQITIAESLGIEGRGEFYDRTGALRDMIQNHLLQLLCIIAMEPPTHNTPDAMRDEKLKVLRSLRILEGDAVFQNTVRGQYQSGEINSKQVPGYLEESGVADDSETETFVALRANIDNWRWMGVPFYLRTGKRLNHKTATVVIEFEPLPHAIFEAGSSTDKPNRLVIQIQPRGARPPFHSGKKTRRQNGTEPGRTQSESGRVLRRPPPLGI